MNIGINLDSVIANMEQEFLFRTNKSSCGIDIWDRHFLLNQYYDDKSLIENMVNDPLFWVNAIPNEDSWNFVNKWFMDNHNIFIVSTRDVRMTEVSCLWMDYWHINYNHLVCGAIHKNKNTYINIFDLDCFIEDDPIEAAILADSIPTFIVSKDSNEYADIGDSIRVKDCYIINDILKESYSL